MARSRGQLTAVLVRTAIAVDFCGGICRTALLSGHELMHREWPCSCKAAPATAQHRIQQRGADPRIPLRQYEWSGRGLWKAAGEGGAGVGRVWRHAGRPVRKLLSHCGLQWRRRVNRVSQSQALRAAAAAALAQEAGLGACGALRCGADTGLLGCWGRAGLWRFCCWDGVAASCWTVWRRPADCDRENQPGHGSRADHHGP